MAAPAPQIVVFPIACPLTRGSLSALCDEAAAAIERTGASVAICDVGEAAADAVTVDALARLQLTARRCGCEAAVRGASSELIDLIDLIGLRNVLPDGD